MQPRSMRPAEFVRRSWRWRSIITVEVGAGRRSARLAALGAGVQARVIGCDRVDSHYEALH
jgi:hypothetical protein